MSIVVFWVVTPCSLAGDTTVSEEHSLAGTRLHGITTQIRTDTFPTIKISNFRCKIYCH